MQLNKHLNFSDIQNSVEASKDYLIIRNLSPVTSSFFALLRLEDAKARQAEDRDRSTGNARVNITLSRFLPLTGVNCGYYT